MDRLGFSEAPGRAPCPWVAIHHGANGGGQDHIHIAVSLVQEDGSIASVWQDLVRLSQFCRDTEISYGLQTVRGRPGQAKPAAGRSEAEAARRRGHPEPDRLALQRAVRAAATQASSEADFVRNLRAAKLVVRPRYAEGGRSSVVGYSVAIRA